MSLHACNAKEDTKCIICSNDIKEDDIAYFDSEEPGTDLY